jgi:hypothetical protein
MVRAKSFSETEPASVNGTTFNLSYAATDELNRMSAVCGASLPQLVRAGLGLLRIAVDGAQNRRRLFLATSAGQPLNEIILPYVPCAELASGHVEEIKRRDKVHDIKSLGGEKGGKMR